MVEKQPSPNLDPTQQQIDSHLRAHPSLRRKMLASRDINNALASQQATVPLDEASKRVDLKLEVLDGIEYVLRGTLEAFGIKSTDEKINAEVLRLARFADVWGENYPHNMQAIEEAEQKLHRGEDF